MRKQKGFTLVELLTVISIIALLLGIFLPALNGVRKRAKSAVCCSNLRQWGLVYKMYTDEFDGKLPRDYGESPWYYSISNYYSNERKILLCPSAKKPTGQKNTFLRSLYGGTSAAWEFFTPKQEEMAWNSIGSYGLNGWAYKPERKDMVVDMNFTTDVEDGASGGGTAVSGGGGNWWQDYWRKRFGLDDKSSSGSGSGSGGTGSTGENSIEDINEISKLDKYWVMAYENQANNIPLVFDCSWLYSYFDDNQSPPSSDDYSNVFFGRSNTTCINRHDGGINMVFMDFSSRKVGLKELWTLKWHKQFNTAGPWTQAGGVLPEKWPKWIRKYKDY